MNATQRAFMRRAAEVVKADQAPEIHRPTLAERERGKTWRPQHRARHGAISWGNVRLGDVRYPSKAEMLAALATLTKEESDD